MPAEVNQIPIIAVENAIAISIQLPIIIRLGARTNKNGTINAGQPNWHADKAVDIGLVLASFAAVKAARATGGVIIDINPK